MQRQGSARVQRSVAVHWRLQQCERQERERRIATEVPSTSRDSHTDQDVSIWVKSVTYFWVTEL